VLKNRISILSICFLILLAGCKKNLSPIEVADKFWTGMKTNDTEMIKETLSRQSIQDLVKMEEILPVKEFNLTRTIIEGNHASVDTDVIIAADKPYQVPVETVLIKENNEWKVQYKVTVANISSGNQIAKIIGNIDELSEEFSEEMQQSMDEFKKAVPEMKRQINKAQEQFRKIIPQLQDKFEELIREIEESLEQPPADEK